MPMPSYRIHVRWNDMKKPKGSGIDCIIGRDFRVKPEALQDFSARLLEPIEQDLVIVAGSIAYSDRIARRHRSAGWAREISLRSEEHTSELQSLMRTSYAVFCLKKNITNNEN